MTHFFLPPCVFTVIIVCVLRSPLNSYLIEPTLDNIIIINLNRKDCHGTVPVKMVESMGI